MHQVHVPWLAAARERNVDEVLRVAEEFECSWPRGELSLRFFRVLIMAHLVQNDAVNAKWALKRCVMTLGNPTLQADALWALLERTVQCCSSNEYSLAFRAFFPTCSPNAEEEEDVRVLESCLLDFLAARHYRQKLAIFGEADGVNKFAAALGVTPDDLALRLRRVKEYEVQRVERELVRYSNRETPEVLRCMVLAGKGT